MHGAYVFAATLLCASCSGDPGKRTTHQSLPIAGKTSPATRASDTVTTTLAAVGLDPEAIARVTYVVTGVSLGGAVTPQTISNMTAWPASIAILAVGMAALTVAVTVYLQAVHGWDRASALLGAFPGGLATTMVLAVECNADVRAVAVVQTVRVAAVAVLLPTVLAVLGLTSTPASAQSWSFDPWQLTLLVGVSSGAALAAALRVASREAPAHIVTIFPDSGTRYLTEHFWEAEEP